MAADAYLKQRMVYQDISGNLHTLAGTTTTTLVTNTKTTEQIFIQKIHIEITTGAAQTWSFQDSTPTDIVPAVSVAAIAHFDFDFGPLGVPCALAKNFVLTISAAGAVGWTSWEGYQKRTAVGVP